MTCQTCGQPIHWSRAARLWYHDSPYDTLTCAGLTVEPGTYHSAEA